MWCNGGLTRGARFSLVLCLCLSFAARAQTSTFAWKNVNIQGMGYVTGLVIHPLPPHDIYIRTDVGGAYRYDRAAARWLPLLDRFGTADSAFGVESIAVDPNDPNTVYAAVAMTRVYTATGGGYYNETTWGEVLVSHSRGVWWTHTGMPPGFVYMGPNDDYRGATGERLAVDPVRPGVVYFASRLNGLWRLNAGGWTELGGGMPQSTTSPGLTFVLASATTLYTGVYGSGVWASTDGGATWKSLGGPANPVRAALAPDGTLVVTCGGDEGATTGSVGRYRNGSWQDITPLGLVASWSGVSFDPTGARLAVAENSGKNVFYSTDAGDSWRQAQAANISAQPPYFPPPTSANYFAQPGDCCNAALAIDPAVPTRLFQTSGYGVLATEDFTAASPLWTWRMQNLEELVIEDLRVPPLAGGADLFSAAADMIGFRHASRDTVPAATLGPINYVAQGTSLAYCASQPRYMAWVGWDEAVGWQAGMTGYSSDNGNTWTPFANTSPGSAGKIAMSATDPNRLVWAPTHSATPQYSADGGHTWQPCLLNGNPLPGSWQLSNEWWNGNVLAADRADGDRFYLYNNGLFYFSMDGGATWQAGAATWPTALPVPYTILVNIAPNPAQAGDVWVSMAPNQNQPGNLRFPLFHSADGGQTFSAVASVDSANFVAFGKGLDAAHPAIYIHGRNGGATTDAVYRSLDLGASWTPVSDPVQQQFGSVSALEADMRQADLVYVGTAGRGILYGYGPASNLTPRSFTAQGVISAASYQGGGVAPGEIVTVFGPGLGPPALANTALDETGSLSTLLQGAQLFFDGEPAPLIFAAAGQLGAIIPYAAAGNASTSVQASYLGVLSLPAIFPVAPSMPGIFTLSSQGSGAGAILNQDDTVNSPSNPAARGDYIMIFATGEGQTSPAGVDGLITGSAPPMPILPVTVQIDNLDATVGFAGEAPGMAAGMLQVNAQIPAGANPGPAVPVVIKAGVVASQPGVTVAVK